MTQLPDWYFVSLINSELISLYVDNFVNNTSHFQINDARQLPIIIPDNSLLKNIHAIALKAINTKKNSSFSSPSDVSVEEKLSFLQNKLDKIVFHLYTI